MKKILSIFIVVIVFVSVLTISVSAYGREDYPNTPFPTYETFKTFYSTKPDVVAVLAKVESCSYYQEIFSGYMARASWSQKALVCVFIGSSKPIKYVSDVAFLDPTADDMFFYVLRAGNWDGTSFNTEKGYTLYKGIDTDEDYFNTQSFYNVNQPSLSQNWYMLRVSSMVSFSDWFGPSSSILAGVPLVSGQAYNGFDLVLNENYYYPVERGSDISKYPDLNSDTPIMDIFLDQNFSGRFDRNLTGVHITPADPANDVEGDFYYYTEDGKGIYTNLDTFGGFIKSLLFLFKHPPKCPDTITIDNNNFPIPVEFVVFRKSWFSGAWFDIVRGLLQCAFLIGFFFFVVRQLKLAFAIETQVDNGGTPKGGGD